MYYLNSRYYNPDWGRFINADAIVGQTGELLGHNMFSYCKNNPVNRNDSSGYRSVRNVFKEFNPMNDDSYADGTYSSPDAAAGFLDKNRKYRSSIPFFDRSEIIRR